MRWLNSILFLFFVSISTISIGQISIDYQFVKNDITLAEKKFSHFNSLKIINNSSESTTLKTELVLPKGWKLAPFMPLEEQVIVPANDSVFVPIKMIIPKYARGGKTYTYRMDIFDESREFIGNTKVNLTIPEVSDWEVEVLENDLVVPFDSSQISFKARIINKGNKSESISVHYQIQDRIASKRVDLEPGFDSTITFTGDYAAYENYKAANREYIGIKASNGLDVQDKTLFFVKFKDQYNGLRSSRRPNSVGFVYDNLPTQNFSTLGFRALGSVSFKDESELSYYINNTDIFNNNQLTNGTVYRIQYLSEQLDLGLGSTFDYGFNLHQINTIIGRRPVINGNNALNLTWRPLITSNNQTTIFVTRNVLQPITTVFGGHQVRLGRTIIEGGFTYNLDFFGKRSLKIGSIRAKIPLGSNHFIQIQTNGVEETHHLLSIGDNSVNTIFNGVDSVLRDRSFNYRMFYSGRFHKNTYLRISNNYSSIYYPNGERGLMNFNAQFTYQLPKRRLFKLGYRLQDKSPYTFQNGIPLSVYGYKRENYLVEYSMPITPSIGVRAGTLIQHHENERISNFTGSMSTFASSDFKVFFNLNTEFGQHRFQFTTLYGYIIVDDFMDNNGVQHSEIPRITALDLRLQYYARSFRFGVNYIAGPNGTVGQYQPDADELFGENIRIFTTWQQRFFQRKLLVSLSGAANYQLSMQRGSVSVIPRIQYLTKNNWRFDVNTNLNYYVLNQNNVWKTQLNPRIQVGVFKEFYLSLDEKHFDLDVICFKDDNGNGQMEAHEFGLPNAKVNVVPHKLKNRKSKLRNPVSLFSNHKGKLFFKKLPEGEYRIEIDNIHSNTEGYIIKEYDQQIIELNQNTIVYIPFAKANTIRGKVTFDKNKFSKTKLDLSKIRITATDKNGNEYYALTDYNGNYTISLPDASYYTVSINNPFLKGIKVKQQRVNINFEDKAEINVDFAFYEKKKKINFD